MVVVRFWCETVREYKRNDEEKYASSVCNASEVNNTFCRSAECGVGDGGCSRSSTATSMLLSASSSISRSIFSTQVTHRFHFTYLNTGMIDSIGRMEGVSEGERWLGSDGWNFGTVGNELEKNDDPILLLLLSLFCCRPCRLLLLLLLQTGRRVVVVVVVVVVLCWWQDVLSSSSASWFVFVVVVFSSCCKVLSS